MQLSLMHLAHHEARRNERPATQRPTVRQLVPLGRRGGARRSA